ncbi:MAG TPA: GAF domain-containing protein [Ignavibacteria bacterium]|nr:GAF domain-containing protein [Ignavibacteria bacterium]
MAKTVTVDFDQSKKEKYESLIPQIVSLISDETSLVANLANITAALKQSFEIFSWVGFYFIDEEHQDELVLGPFQGKTACTRLKERKGVCWESIKQQKTLIVDDVHEFPGHIACDAGSNSEIVVPIMLDGMVSGVLDIDSYKFASFDETDKEYLERLISEIKYIFY